MSGDPRTVPRFRAPISAVVTDNVSDQLGIAMTMPKRAPRVGGRKACLVSDVTPDLAICHSFWSVS